MLPVQLRPAWRNYWFSILLIAGLLMAAQAAALGQFVGYMGVGFGMYSALALASLAVLLALVVIVRRFSWQFVIDDNRVLRHHGIVARNQQSVRIKDLRSVELRQSLLQRLLNVGDLRFYSAGSASAEVVFFGIRRPTRWRDEIHHAMDRGGA